MDTRFEKFRKVIFSKKTLKALEMIGEEQDRYNQSLTEEEYNEEGEEDFRYWMEVLMLEHFEKETK